MELNCETITIKDVFIIIKKRIVMIVGIVVGFILVASIFSWFLIKPVYQSSTKLFIGKEPKLQDTIVIQGGEYISTEVTMYQSLMKTYGEIIKSPDLIERALDNANLDLISTEVLEGLSVNPQDKSQILEMNFKTNNINDAQMVLNAINQEFMTTSKKIIGNGTIEVIMEPTVPVKPISPNKVMNLSIAFMAGLMFSICLALFLEYLDNSVKTKEDIEKLIGITVIGMVPKLDSKDKNNNKTSSNFTKESGLSNSKDNMEV